MPPTIRIRSASSPNSVDNILGWQSLKGDTKKKLLWGNAARFFKQS